MHRPEKWWVGLVPLGVIYLAAMMFKTAPVETDLVARAGEELQRSGLGWAKARLVGRDAVVEGVAPEPDSQQLARDAADRAWGVRRVADKTTVTPEQKPYVTTATREGAKITLTGSVPNDAARAVSVAVAKAAFPNAEVVDQRVRARGAPATYAAGLAQAAAQLGKLSSGTASLSDSTLSITGTAMDFPGYDSVNAALRALPQGLALGKAEIQPPRVSPFEFNAVKSASGIALTGYIPSEAARAGIVAAARAAAGSGAVTDSLRVASGAPAAHAAGVSQGAAQLGKLSSGTVSVSDSTLSISGTAMDFPGFDSVNAALRALPQGLALGKAEILPPRVSPFEFNAVKSASGIALTGYIPSEAARAGIVAAARAAAGSGAVTDSLRVASGAPAGVDLGAGAGFALAQLGRLTAGTARIADQNLTVAGAAPTVPAYQAVTSALAAASLPGAVKLGSQAITGPTQSPYTWGAQREASGLTMTGFVPDDAARGALVDAAKGLFPGLNIIDRMQLALGAPAGFLDAARAGLAQLARLATGTVGVNNASLSVAGEALQGQTADQVRAAMAGLPQGFRGQANIAVRPPPAPPAPPAPAASPNIIVPTLPPIVLSAIAMECQEKFKTRLAAEQVRFATGRADIQDASNDLIKALAEQAKVCPAARIEVQGHTDSDGNAESNQALSERRAQAVAARLVDYGVEKGRVTAAGFGPSRPVAPNDTPENKAKNRRIEFQVSE